MKALALSMAVLGSAVVALPAQAQTNVTFYGRINTSWEYTEVEDQPSVMRLVNNSSRIGFRGNEELGNGLSALFQFEAGFDSDQGNFRQRRDTFVGLKSNFGTLKMGSSPARCMTPPTITSACTTTTPARRRTRCWVPAQRS